MKQRRNIYICLDTMIVIEVIEVLIISTSLSLCYYFFINGMFLVLTPSSTTMEKNRLKLRDKMDQKCLVMYEIQQKVASSSLLIGMDFLCIFQKLPNFSYLECTKKCF